jgi:hypothetical protein
LPSNQLTPVSAQEDEPVAPLCPGLVAGPAPTPPGDSAAQCRNGPSLAEQARQFLIERQKRLIERPSYSLREKQKTGCRI